MRTKSRDRHTGKQAHKITYRQALPAGGGGDGGGGCRVNQHRGGGVDKHRSGGVDRRRLIGGRPINHG